MQQPPLLTEDRKCRATDAYAVTKHFNSTEKVARFFASRFLKKIASRRVSKLARYSDKGIKLSTEIPPEKKKMANSLVFKQKFHDLI